MRCRSFRILQASGLFASANREGVQRAAITGALHAFIVLPIHRQALLVGAYRNPDCIHFSNAVGNSYTPSL